MKKSTFSFLCLAVIALFLTACGNLATTGGNTTATPAASSPVTLSVFAAASLTKSFNALANKYHQLHPNVSIRFDYDSSSVLEQQLASGAPADIFASADTANMQKASQDRLVNSSQVFARNRLVVILPVSNPAHIVTLQDLARPGVKVDLAAASVPVGKYARQVLDNLGKSPDYGSVYEAAVLKNVVSEEENDQAIVQKVQLGEADAGIVYVSDMNPATVLQLTELSIPDGFNVIASYPIAVVKTSTQRSEAGAFIQYILSPDGQAILKEYNFIPIHA